MSKVYVRTTDEVKEPHLRGLVGELLIDHEFTDMVSSYMVRVPGHEQLLQCGSFEIEPIRDAVDLADPDDLNKAVEFDSPFEVLPDGSIVPHVRRRHAPNTYHVEGESKPEIDGQGWEFVDGFSGQYRYSGPVMHASEQLSGGMADHVLATPGIYVLCVVEVLPDEDDDQPEPAGWVLLRAV